MPEFLPKGWTREDILYLLEQVDQGKYVLIADSNLGLPTIHMEFGAEVRHAGFGLMIVETPTYKLAFDAGGAMKKTKPSEHGWTDLRVTEGTYPLDLTGLRDKLVNLLTLMPEPLTSNPTPDQGVPIEQTMVAEPAASIAVADTAVVPEPITAAADEVSEETEADKDENEPSEEGGQDITEENEEEESSGTSSENGAAPTVTKAAATDAKQEQKQVENILKTFPFDINKMPFFITMEILPARKDAVPLPGRKVLVILDDRRDEIDREPVGRFTCALSELQDKVLDALTQYGQGVALRQETLTNKQKAVDEKKAKAEVERKKKEEERKAKSKSGKAAEKTNGKPQKVDLSKPEKPVEFPKTAAVGQENTAPQIVSQQMSLFG